MSYIHGYDPDTLREQVDPRQCKERLDEIGEQRSLPALLERVWLLKVLGRLEDSLVLSEQSVRVARMAGTRKDLLRARILHASVLQFRGAYAAAEQELTIVRRRGRGPGLGMRSPRSPTSTAARCTTTPATSTSARVDFKRALFLRQESGAPDDQLESTLLAIDAADRRRARRIGRQLSRPRSASVVGTF